MIRYGARACEPAHHRNDRTRMSQTVGDLFVFLGQSGNVPLQPIWRNLLPET